MAFSVPLLTGLVGSLIGDAVGYRKTGSYWNMARYGYSAAGAVAGALVGRLVSPADASLTGLGAVATLLEDAVPSNDPQVPLKLRRMEVVRGDQPLPATPTLKLVALSTKQKATRANKTLPTILKTIDAKYGPLILEAALLHNVPFEVLMTKLSIENPDLKATVVTGGGATGLMQITPGTADSALRDEFKKGDLTESEAKYFRSVLGVRYDRILAGGKGHTTKDLQQVRYNLHIGALAIGQYLRKYTDPRTGIVSVHKAVAEYNRGGRAQVANSKTQTPDQLIAYKNGVYSTPAVTQQYIKMYVGPDAGLDLLTRHKVVAVAPLTPRQATAYVQS